MRFSDLLTNLPNLVTTPAQDATVTAPASENAQTVDAGGIFLARRGASVDGHDLIDQAIKRGVVAVVGERPPEQVNCPVPYAQVVDGRAALGPLAAAYHDYPSRKLTVIGVTGTDGKTTTCSILHSILTAAGLHTGMISTVSAEIGDEALPTGLHVTTPPAHEVQMYLARMVEAGLTHAVLEVTSHGLAQGRVNGVDFDVAVLTNVTHEHLDFHGTWDQYRRDKARLFALAAKSFRKPGTPKYAVINADDPSADLFRLMAEGVDRVLTYGQDLVIPNLDMRPETVEYGVDMTRFLVQRADGLRLQVETGLVGPFNVANILAAVATAGAVLGDDVTPEMLRSAVYAGIRDMPPIPGRMERINAGQDFLAVVDFAHTPNALRRALEAARTMIARDRRVIAVFGSAGLRDHAKRRMMAEIGMQLADLVILTAEDPRTESLAAILKDMADGCRSTGGEEGDTFWRVMDRGKALAEACALARQGDLVIACGKGHEQSMCFGTTEYPWDDRKAMYAALRGTPLLTLPTASL
ncbi:MAG: UDP-N-acetylmuramoyl-L-alanyl-D-glutamate--2,6-diaminopimelate ligase [Anaerolineae bacterium]|nr:UDP-N-acetylmuramoyl-L-alanyl-D-glutamate--2,6-diaminopimelate ligase [Anaerolineae bacterium]